jgi:hypothetical protein
MDEVLLLKPLKKVKSIRTSTILKISKDGRLVFPASYTNETLTKIINDIAEKDTARIQWYLNVDELYKKYDLNSRDILRILREGSVIGNRTSPSGIELNVTMTFNFRNASPYLLTVWLDLNDNIHLADIQMCEGGEQ